MLFLRKIKIPTLLLDEQKCRTNIRMMAEKARKSGVKFRPHFKTHQSAEIGEWFREEGVAAITVSSVGMAGYFANASWKDITIAFPVNLREIDEINRLAAVITLNLLVASETSIRFLASSLTRATGIFVEIDTGYHRSGISPGEEATISGIIRACDMSPMLDFKGFLTYFGETYEANSLSDIKRIFHHGISSLTRLRDNLNPNHSNLISIGDTLSCSLLDHFPGTDEIRPGNFVFYDLMQAEIGACETNQIAVCVAAPVVEIHPERKEAVVYAGAVHLSQEQISWEGEDCYGLVVSLAERSWSEPLQGCYVKKLSQEHGLIHLTTQVIQTLQPGDLIGILPVHSCLTAAAMHKYLTLDGRIISSYIY